MLKAPQITYLDYKSNGENYDPSFAKVFQLYLVTILSYYHVFVIATAKERPGFPPVAYVTSDNR